MECSTGWQAPEVTKRKSVYGCPADVWAYGRTIWYLRYIGCYYALWFGFISPVCV
jgi:serine/threonine protein kinase